MSNFKDIIAADSTTFLNPDEFGMAHTIDDREMVIIIDDDELRRRKSSSNPTDGIYDAELLFFALKSDLPSRPVIGRPMKVDGRLFRVMDVNGDDPVMYTIILERNGS